MKAVAGCVTCAVTTTEATRLIGMQHALCFKLSRFRRHQYYRPRAGQCTNYPLLLNTAEFAYNPDAGLDNVYELVAVTVFLGGCCVSLYYVYGCVVAWLMSVRHPTRAPMQAHITQRMCEGAVNGTS